MASASQNVKWDGQSRRRVPRVRLQAPVDVTVLRSGSFQTLPGRAFNVCEGGIGAMVAGELRAGESAAVEIQLSDVTEPLCTRVTVRYQDRLRCGLEFAAISADQRSIIRSLAMEPGEAGALSATQEPPAKASGKGVVKDRPSIVRPSGRPGEGRSSEDRNSEDRTIEPSTNELPKNGLGKDEQQKNGPRRPAKKISGKAWLIGAMILVIAAAVFWWRWDHGWEELEAGLRSPGNSATDKPQARVPAELMQKLVVHRVEAVYPADARKQNLQGVVALDIVVGRDGSVLSMHALNGPEILAQAAMDALRWWRFEPYRINGEPAVVETTVAVEFKK